MPTWKVSDPMVNLWLLDTPSVYKASRGWTVAFKLFYKNRQGSQNDIDNGEAKVFSVGSHWCLSDHLMRPDCI